ncbi:scaffold protein Nfu/NifU N terminal-domain-containing protein [Aspergillus transmontanensis]|uniref:Scaffold protein Nfu/NifU N terminal-domain-containing protein n=1 Tax=Aspergillus transmontanensis TaxID=1034304 RepID=A0A5N6WEY2_9EURO|nr:scaffold protein Nfu/NifU N terminal-domain-containing protein [Aspergillus transmontanensis]
MSSSWYVYFILIWPTSFTSAVRGNRDDIGSRKWAAYRLSPPDAIHAGAERLSAMKPNRNASGASRTAMSAPVMSGQGFSYTNPPMQWRMNSTKIYGNAIQMLNGKISSGRALGKDVLYTTIIFQIYEISKQLINCSPPGFGAWIAHVQGSSAIINQCSGQDDETAASKLFRRQLKFVTVSVLILDCPDFYNPSAWQDNSLQDIDSPEPIDELIDRLADCSALMEQVDGFLEKGAEDHDQILYSGRELLFTYQLLEVLQVSAGHVSLAGCYSPSGEHANSEVTLNPEIIADFTTLAEHYADQPDLKTLGAQLLLAPLSQSAQFYSVHELAEKYRWCQEVFVLLPQLGLGIGYFLKDMYVIRNEKITTHIMGCDFRVYICKLLYEGIPEDTDVSLSAECNATLAVDWNVGVMAQRLSMVEPSSRTVIPNVFASYRTIHRSARLPAITASEARHRPTLRPHQQSAVIRVNGPSPVSKRSIFIQTENTPNPDALKFIPNHRVLPEGFPTSFLEYLSPRSTLAPPHPSPLAANLFNVDGVTSIFFGPEFITVTKASDANWAHIKPEIFSLITQAVTSGEPIVNTVAKSGENAQEGGEEESLSYNEEDDEVVSMIKELLETRIRPAIQEDGGDIELRGFENGIVMLKLRGACRTCDSSTVTLKNGIESMLMHYIEEVQGVEQVMDEEEEISMHEFAKFEEKLRQQKGAAATASTGGKGTLDSAP